MSVNSTWIKRALKILNKKGKRELEGTNHLHSSHLSHSRISLWVCVCARAHSLLSTEFLLDLGKRNRHLSPVFTSGYANNTELNFATENEC